MMNLTRKTKFVAGLVGAMLASAGAVRAQQLLQEDALQFHFQAKLNQGNGDPLEPGDYCLTFNLYDVPLGGTSLGGIQVDENVADGSGGVVSVLVPLGSNGAALFDGGTRYLGVAVDSGVCPVTASAELSGRLQIGAVPYSLRTNFVGNAELTDHVDLGDPSNTGSLVLFNSGLGNPIMRFNGAKGEIITWNLSGTAQVLRAGAETSSGAGFIDLKQSNDLYGVQLHASEDGAGAAMTLHNSAGLPTIELDADYGLDSRLKLYDRYQHENVFINSSNWGGGSIFLRNRNDMNTVSIVADDTDFSGAIYLKDSSGNLKLTLDTNWQDTGVSRVITDVVQINGGSDLSEQFEVSPADSSPAPGMVVSIDPDQPGKLVVTDRPYDHKVAGIISGAGDVRPGMLMGQSGSVADGAILGKAMSSLSEGKGLVLVLVSLQ